MKRIYAFALIALLAALNASAAIREAWTFETDSPGTLLTNAFNSGTIGSIFEDGGAGVLEADGQGALSITPAYTDVWGGGGTNLNAVLAETNAIVFLRYDLTYDVTSNTTGTSVGISFVDSTTSNDVVAGIGFVYDPNQTINPPTPGKTLKPVRENSFPLAGALSAIAKVDVDDQTLSVWYSTNGKDFVSGVQNVEFSANFTSISKLRIEVTGSASGAANDFVNVEDIRVSDSWDEIIALIDDKDAAPIVTITRFTDSRKGGMKGGDTNILTVVMKNLVSPAINATTLLTFIPSSTGAASDFTILSSSNTPVAVPTHLFFTNTYEVVANIELGRGTFNVQPYVDGVPSGDSSNVFIFVGSRVEPISAAVTNDVLGAIPGGDIPGRVEAGETFDLVITSLNNGGLDVYNITNSLTVDSPAYFAIGAASPTNIYDVVSLDSSTSTTYQVVCSPSTPKGNYVFTAVNSSSVGAWTNQFTVSVALEAIPVYSTNLLTLTVLAGSSSATSMEVFNNGNLGAGYNIIFDPLRAGMYDSEQTFDKGLEYFLPGTDLWTIQWSTNLVTETVDISLGFTFEPFGVAYTNFSISQLGTLTVKGDDGQIATLTPYTPKSKVDRSTISYKLSSGLVIVTWGRGTAYEFQAWIYKNGTIRYLYDNQAKWPSARIGLKFDNLYQTFDHTPGLSGRDGLLLTPTSFVSASPQSGTIGRKKTQNLVFTADASSQLGFATYLQTATIDWADATPDQVITIEVNVANRGMAGFVITPQTNNFSGAEGAVSTAPSMTISNPQGSIPMTYFLSDAVLSGAGYTAQRDTNSSFASLWVDISPNSEHIVTASQLGSKEIDIGFSFPLFGNLYTSLVVNANGTLTLGGRQTIMPFSSKLSLNGNSQILTSLSADKTEFRVTWQGMSDSNSDNNQTFQAVLYRTGLIRFNYAQLSGNWPNGKIGVSPDNATDELFAGSLLRTAPEYSSSDVNYSSVTTVTYKVITTEISPGWYVETPTAIPESTNIVTSYEPRVVRESLLFTPANTGVISFSPVTGTLAPGFSAQINVTGDARSLTNGVTSSTILDIYAEAVGDFALDLANTNDVFIWQRSSRGDDEYYLIKEDGSSPGFGQPTAVLVNGVDEGGAIGSLLVRTWGWGRNPSDNLNFDTIYVRLTGDANPESATSGLGVVQKKPFSITQRAVAEINFSVTASLGDAVSPVTAWGAQNPTVSSTKNSDGSRTLSWPASVMDILSRTYTIWYTTSLGSGWTELATVVNGTSYTDSMHNDEPVIFYKVTVL